MSDDLFEIFDFGDDFLGIQKSKPRICASGSTKEEALENVKRAVEYFQTNRHQIPHQRPKKAKGGTP